jgi:hypothetical protein
MNYRRGFQRSYAVLTVAWIVLVTFMVLSGRWIWEPWRIVPTTLEASLIDAGGKPIASGPDNEWVVLKEAPSEVAPIHQMEEIVMLAMPIPSAGYLLLFCVLPWV